MREIEQTVALGERTPGLVELDQRAREDARVEMQTALADEKAQIDRMPFTQEEIETALTRLGEKTARSASAPPVHGPARLRSIGRSARLFRCAAVAQVSPKRA